MFVSSLIFLSVLNNLLLIAVFLIRKNNLAFVERWGKLYLFVVIPVGITWIIGLKEQMNPIYSVFFVIFLLFLGIEALFDHILKLDFRTNWKPLIPYLILYYMMNYGMFAMTYKENNIAGIVILVLIIVQIGANIYSHPRKRK
jgi:hypothetical protein